MLFRLSLCLLVLAAAARDTSAQTDARPGRSPADVVAQAPQDAWRSLDPARTVYFEVPGGQVVVELAPQFAPVHVSAIEAIVRAGLFDGGAVVRSQDNYVAQWGVRALADDEATPDLLAQSLAGEFEVASDGLAFAALPDADVYAPQAGFVDGFAAAREADGGPAWLVHCYGAVGVGRSTGPDTGNGSSLYAVTGHAPRHLDRNMTMVGRVVSGMEHLSSLPRGTGRLGFYESPRMRARIASARVGSDVPAEDRLALDVMRTDSNAFRAFVEARRSRVEPFFFRPAGRVDVCNVPVPTRAATD